MKKPLLLSLLISAIFSQEITLDFLKSQPKGIARDFYIWRFLENPKTSLQDSIQAYELIFRNTPKIEKLVTQKGYIHELPKDLKCKGLSLEQLKNEDEECITFGLKLSTIPLLNHSDIQALLNKLPQDSALYQEIKILSSKNILNQALKNQDAKIFSEIFYGLNSNQRIPIFNAPIPIQTLESLANQNNPNFNKMLQYILLSPQFPHFKHSILQANITNADERILLLIGILQAQNKQDSKAMKYFQLAYNVAKNPLTKDKALFWQYLVSNQQSFLTQLAQSIQVNLYTIFANQKLKQTPQYKIISNFENLKKGNPNFDITNPFEWQLLRDSLFKLDSQALKPKIEKDLTYSISEPHFAYMLNRITKYKTNYFIMPYANSLQWQDNHQKALTYAIAKQESNFLPAIISTSYALGMMQIMPFNVKPFSKSMGKADITLDDLFKPQIALEMGRFYLAELEEEFKHPLFVAYAYNGGPGFWRRTLAKKTLFLKNRKYEPWLSLELIPYEESKNYGQIVLANYIIYQELLGKKIDIDQFLKQTLVN